MPVNSHYTSDAQTDRTDGSTPRDRIQNTMKTLRALSKSDVLLTDGISVLIDRRARQEPKWTISKEHSSNILGDTTYEDLTEALFSTHVCPLSKKLQETRHDASIANNYLRQSVDAYRRAREQKSLDSLERWQERDSAIEEANYHLTHLAKKVLGFQKGMNIVGRMSESEVAESLAEKRKNSMDRDGRYDSVTSHDRVIRSGFYVDDLIGPKPNV